MTFGKAKLDHTLIINEAIQVFDEFQCARSKVPKIAEALPESHKLEGWFKPLEGGIKINFDAAIGKKGSCLAAITRDEGGKYWKLQ